VAREHRLLGVGTSLLQEAIARCHAEVVLAETDGDAVDFYIRFGFEVTSLGDKYPGVERFACRWSR
jgi:ribosomal protein S18 acetylase RimI-like enzyme